MGLKDSYDILNKIGDGAFSSVFLAVHRPTGIHVAIKIIKKINDSEHHNSKSSDVMREVDILKSLDHPNIIKLFEFFEDDFNYYFVQELCENGNVAHFIMEYGSSERPEIKKIFLELINALYYLHEVAHVIHCDIKAENILLDSNNNVKLADFGFSYNHTYTDEDNQKFSEKIKGSPAYIAPEVLQGGKNTILSDIWSSGVFLYFMLTGSLPFEDNELDGLIHSIIKMKPAFPSYLSSDATRLLKKILKKNPLKRFTIPQIKNYKWLKETSNSIDEIYKNLNSQADNIDIGIVQHMIKINPDLFQSTEIIIDDILSGKINDNTTSYKILLRKKENEILNNQFKLLKKKTTPQRSSDLRSTPQFHYRPRTRSQNNKQEQMKRGKRPQKVLISSKGSVPKFDISIENLK